MLNRCNLNNSRSTKLCNNFFVQIYLHTPKKGAILTKKYAGCNISKLEIVSDSVFDDFTITTTKQFFQGNHVRWNEEIEQTVNVCDMVDSSVIIVTGDVYHSRYS